MRERRAGRRKVGSDATRVRRLDPVCPRAPSDETAHLDEPGDRGERRVVVRPSTSARVAAAMTISLAQYDVPPPPRIGVALADPAAMRRVRAEEEAAAREGQREEKADARAKHEAGRGKRAMRIPAEKSASACSPRTPTPLQIRRKDEAGRPEKVVVIPTAWIWR
jgi:hypothetical protein